MSNRSVHEIRLGLVKAVIWANQTDAGVRHQISVARLYKDGDEWATSETFGRDDLPLLAKVADMAHTWIFTQTKSQNGPSKPEPDGQNKPGNRAGSRR